MNDINQLEQIENAQLSKIESTCFHDGEISRIFWTGDNITIIFKDIFLDEVYYEVNVNLNEVRKVTRNEETVHEMILEGEGSDVISFTRSGETAKLVLQWINYGKKERVVSVYDFTFGVFDMKASKQNIHP